MAKRSARAAWGERPGPSVTVADTGEAGSHDDGAAVTGYRGPAPEGGGVPGVVRVSGTGDATAAHGGTAVSGYVHTLTVQQPLLREPACWPHQVGVVPLPARSFQHRGEADRLRSAVAGGGTAVPCQVLTGTGGVGKTQLAADYARAAWADGGLDVLLWVTASAQASVVSGYAQAGVELCRADPDDPDRAARQFLAWLAPKPGQRPCRWLVVLDDLADPDDLIVHSDDPAHRYSLWPPASPDGRTLLTTRRRDAALFGEGRRRIEVGLFTPDESLAYLTASLHAHGRTEPADQLTALARDLGHLPLALAQAAAYLVDSGETAAAYRGLLADRSTHLADLAPDALPDEQAVALAAAWSLSVDRADLLRPAGLARPMLHLAALLDPNGIPHDVLTGEAARAHLAAHRTPTSPDSVAVPAPVSRRDAVRALRALERLSLIDHRPDSPHQAVRIHQLIQRATRDTLTPARQDRYTRAAADALTAAWPAVERDTALAQALRANTGALARHAEDALYRPDTHAVLYRLGTSLGDSGQISAALTHFRRMVDTSTRRLGPDHPDTLAARHSLAWWQGEAGDAAGAATAYAELLADQVRVLGQDHPRTLAARNGLARSRGEVGDAAGAAAAYAGLLPDVVRVLGQDHPDTLATRQGLARWLGEVGDAAGAASAYAGLLADRARVLGEDHPDTLATRQGLAWWRGKAGDPAGAAAAYAELLADQARVLGEDHPDALTTRHDLAWWRGKAGDPAGAAAAYAELLADRERVLGHDHPDTLATRHNLAWWRGKAGDAAGAAAAYAELLAGGVRLLGEDHPRTLVTRHNLAWWRGKAGDPAGAAAAYAELLADRERVLGHDHPDTLATRRSLARWRGEAGDAAGAAAAYAGLLPDMVRVLGEDHPDTLATRHDLARWRERRGV